MGEEFYAAIKLVTGEEIFSLISVDDNDGDPIVILQNPIIMKVFHSKGQMYIKIKDWIEIANDDFFMITQDKIITMTEITDKKIIDVYDNYVTEESFNGINFDQRNSQEGSVKLSEKMGYISSVEDARKNLERIFKGIKES